MTETRHLVTVWDPSVSNNPMDEHIRVLHSWLGKMRDESATIDDVYVWWGKIKSPNRQQRLPHLAEILEIQKQIADGIESHVYLTDYRSLYVAFLSEITEDDPREGDAEESEHVPAYYGEARADFWFCLSDIRRLVADDTAEVVRQLKHLRNTRYNDRPVSLYGGMVELPLIVEDRRQARWFSDPEVVTGGKLWVEIDAELRSETEKMHLELRQNVLGSLVWGALEPQTRNFVAAAEAVFRARRDDPGFDFSGAAVQYAKAVETELNALLFPPIAKVLAKAPPAQREERVGDRVVDLGGSVPHQTIGAIQNLLAHSDIIRRAVEASQTSTVSSWLIGRMPPQLAALAEIRNPAAHAGATDRDAVVKVRESVLGIGCEGLIEQVGRAKL